VSTPKEIVENQQLKARDYWVKVRHDELGQSFSYPGPFVKYLKATCPYHRAPLIGEHNKEIYQGELGLSEKQLVTLKQARVI
jgi:crotonobetainyl-CoA:carnitine CoA-transferase CaiB-like acyl-CoA transferase